MVSRPEGEVQGLTEEAAHNLRAVAQSGTALARGLQEVSREVVTRSQQRLQRNLDGLQALARCRSMTDFVEVQTSLLRDNLEQSVENSRRLAELTIQMTDEATKTVTVQAEKTALRLNRAARASIGIDRRAPASEPEHLHILERLMRSDCWVLVYKLTLEHPRCRAR